MYRTEFVRRVYGVGRVTQATSHFAEAVILGIAKSATVRPRADCEYRSPYARARAPPRRGRRGTRPHVSRTYSCRVSTVQVRSGGLHFHLVKKPVA